MPLGFSYETNRGESNIVREERYMPALSSAHNPASRSYFPVNMSSKSAINLTLRVAHILRTDTENMGQQCLTV